MPSKTTVDQITIKIAGTYLPPNIMNSLIEVEVDSSMGFPDMFIMRFHDDDLALIDDTRFEPGKAIEISLAPSITSNANANGNANATISSIIKGEITAIEPEFHDDATVTLTIRGFDKSHRLSRGTKTRVFKDVTHTDIVNKIAQEHGISVNADATSTTFKHVFQDNQTDWAFLEDLAIQNGYQLSYANDKLNFKKYETDGTTIELTWGVNLRSFSPRLSLARQVNEVEVRGWDILSKQPIVGTATSSTTQPKIGVGQSGGQMLQSKLAAAKHTEVRRAVFNQQEATDIAKALLDKINTEFVEAEGVAFGNPAIKAGVIIKITNIGNRFRGEYRITSAIHRYTANSGYDTAFKIQGPKTELIADYVKQENGQSQKATWPGVYPAIVTSNKDEENNTHYGHIKVKFPWLNDQLESYWARVISMGAGNGRGALWLPEVNDEVMVVFEQGDFNRPCVIGGVWNGQDAPPEPLNDVSKNGKIEVRTLKTRAGHIIRFTDESGTEKIEIIDCKTKNKLTMDTENEVMTLITSDKTKLVLDGKNEKVTLESSKDTDVISQASGNLNVTAATGNIKISNQSGAIDIKSASGNITMESSGGNVTIKGVMINIEATANVTIKGNAGATLQSTAMTAVKGNPLMLN